MGKNKQTNNQKNIFTASSIQSVWSFTEFTLHRSCINNPCSPDRDGQVTDSVRADPLCRTGLAKPPRVRSSVSLRPGASGGASPCSTSYRFLTLSAPEQLNKVLLWAGQSPWGYMCRFMCKARWSDLENALSHRWHWKGRWPVCLR